MRALNLNGVQSFNWAICQACINSFPFLQNDLVSFEEQFQEVLSEQTVPIRPHPGYQLDWLPMYPGEPGLKLCLVARFETILIRHAKL